MDNHIKDTEVELVKVGEGVVDVFGADKILDEIIRNFSGGETLDV